MENYIDYIGLYWININSIFFFYLSFLKVTCSKGPFQPLDSISKA